MYIFYKIHGLTLYSLSFDCIAAQHAYPYPLKASASPAETADSESLEAL